MNLLNLQTALYKVLRNSKNEAVDYYRENNNGKVPLWVLSNALTFGNIEHFFNLMKPRERTKVCKRIAQATGRLGQGNPYFDPKDARLALDPIVKFRNKCAHDDRLYCAKVGHRGSLTDYAHLLEIVEPFLCREDYDAFLGDVLLTILAYSDKSNFAEHVLTESGFSRLLKRAAEVTTERLEGNQATAMDIVRMNR